ncbi:MAG: Sua5/YciO/YrdC/YwlC family protein [Pirellula sp.]|nr:Sua5/YciO/YrdC/YwlC family protein [Pirellula sp.]
MVKQFDWKNTEDPRDVVHLAVQAVAEGHIVAVPGDCCYLLVGSGMQESAVDKLAHIASLDKNQHGLTLMLRSPSELLDYFPDLTSSIRRFASKVWPGPITIDLADSQPNSVLRCLNPEVVAKLTQPNQKLRTSQPYHPVFQQMGRLLAGPLVAAPATDSSGKLARTVESISSEAHAIAINDGETSEIGLPTLVEFEKNIASITREGIVTEDYLKGLSRITILFVCTGNTCRSPMASALMNRKIQERFADLFPGEQVPIVAYSAGVSAYGGDPASPGAIHAIQHYGTNLDAHSSSQLSQEMVEQADLILTMGSRHKHVIVSQWPSVANKVHMISPSGSEITDPFGGPYDVYERCAAQLDDYTNHWIEQLKLSDLILWNHPQDKKGKR